MTDKPEKLSESGGGTGTPIPLQGWKKDGMESGEKKN